MSQVVQPGQRVRTRVAPSPTGFLHLGTARTALYSWAFARHYGGDFILRIEDTDEARSTQAAVEQIIESMQWLGLDYDEGPFYQMQRISRYQEVIADLITQGKAYFCYSSPQELDAMREAQKARGEKPRYDGRWRPESGKVLPEPPAGVAPVVRFCTPLQGDVEWQDMVKGNIRFANSELDDLIIARPVAVPPSVSPAQSPGAWVGTPTYNFCVVVDDWDMGITHVIRGDDHVNNTPRQIHIFEALGVSLPVFGHLPMILGQDGEKLSKRHGAVGVQQYSEMGYLPEAMINYLARLGWSHGDEELFDRQQLLDWFDGEHLSKSAAQWDGAKLDWVNAHYIKRSSDEHLAACVQQHWQAQGISHQLSATALQAACALFKDRCATTVELAQWLSMYCQPVDTQQSVWKEGWASHCGESTQTAVLDLAQQLQDLPVWSAEAIQNSLKAVLKQHGLKMPQLAIPVRLLVCGRAQTPSVDQTLVIFLQQDVVQRLREVQKLS